MKNGKKPKKKEQKNQKPKEKKSHTTCSEGNQSSQMDPNDFQENEEENSPKSLNFTAEEQLVTNENNYGSENPEKKEELNQGKECLSIGSCEDNQSNQNKYNNEENKKAEDVGCLNNVNQGNTVVQNNELVDEGSKYNENCSRQERNNDDEYNNNEEKDEGEQGLKLKNVLERNNKSEVSVTKEIEKPSMAIPQHNIEDNKGRNAAEERMKVKDKEYNHPDGDNETDRRNDFTQEEVEDKFEGSSENLQKHETDENRHIIQNFNTGREGTEHSEDSESSSGNSEKDTVEFGENSHFISQNENENSKENQIPSAKNEAYAEYEKIQEQTDLQIENHSFVKDYEKDLQTKRQDDEAQFESLKLQNSNSNIQNPSQIKRESDDEMKHNDLDEKTKIDDEMDDLLERLTNLSVDENKQEKIIDRPIQTSPFQMPKDIVFREIPSPLNCNMIMKIIGYDVTLDSTRYTMYQYNKKKNRWLPPLQLPLRFNEGNKVTRYENDVYSIGGKGQENNAWKFNLDTFVLELLPSLVTKRMFSGAGFLVNTLYVAGGKDNQKNSIASVERLENGAWQEVESLRMMRSSPQLYGLQKSLYAIGGFFEKDKPAGLEVYDASVNQWTEIPTPYKLLRPRVTYWCSINKDNIICKFLDEEKLLVFNTTTNQWSENKMLMKTLAKSGYCSDLPVQTEVKAIVDNELGKLFLCRDGIMYIYCQETRKVISVSKCRNFPIPDTFVFCTSAVTYHL